MTMRKKVFFMCLSLGCAGLLASCSAENDAEGTEQASNQKGKVTFDLASSVEFTTGTRAVDESSYQNFDNYTVNILDNKGASKFSGTFATLQSRLPLELDLGSYSVTASYGTEYDASRDGFKVEGSNTFTISRGDSMELSKCTWASMSPGVRYRPVTSISCRPLYWPIPTILLPLMATSATSHVFKNTLNTFPPFNTRSASCRPMAVSICSSKVVARQKSMFCTCFPIKMNYQQ